MPSWVLPFKYTQLLGHHGYNMLCISDTENVVTHKQMCVCKYTPHMVLSVHPQSYSPIKKID